MQNAVWRGICFSKSICDAANMYLRIVKLVMGRLQGWICGAFWSTDFNFIYYKRCLLVLHLSKAGPFIEQTPKGGKLYQMKALNANLMPEYSNQCKIMIINSNILPPNSIYLFFPFVFIRDFILIVRMRFIQKEHSTT